jgi:hypothetical protein
VKTVAGERGAEAMHRPTADAETMEEDDGFYLGKGEGGHECVRPSRGAEAKQGVRSENRSPHLLPHINLVS